MTRATASAGTAATATMSAMRRRRSRTRRFETRRFEERDFEERGFEGLGFEGRRFETRDFEERGFEVRGFEVRLEDAAPAMPRILSRAPEHELSEAQRTHARARTHSTDARIAVRRYPHAARVRSRLADGRGVRSASIHGGGMNHTVAATPMPSMRTPHPSSCRRW